MAAIIYWQKNLFKGDNKAHDFNQSKNDKYLFENILHFITLLSLLLWDVMKRDWSSFMPFLFFHRFLLFLPLFLQFSCEFWSLIVTIHRYLPLGRKSKTGENKTEKNSWGGGGDGTITKEPSRRVLCPASETPPCKCSRHLSFQGVREAGVTWPGDRMTNRAADWRHVRWPASVQARRHNATRAADGDRRY